MAKFKVDDIRTVALVGHEVAGKTSLADTMLFKAKAVDRRGSVDEGTSVSDYDEGEKEHKYSIDCSVLNHAPIGQGAQFSKVVSVLNPPPQPPAGCLVDLNQARSQLVDAIVECDEALMEKYLTEGSVSAEELKTALPKALAAGTVVPI